MTVPVSSKTCEVTITPLLLFTVEEELIMATLTCSLKLGGVHSYRVRTFLLLVLKFAASQQVRTLFRGYMAVRVCIDNYLTPSGSNYAR